MSVKMTEMTEMYQFNPLVISENAFTLSVLTHKPSQVGEKHETFDTEVDISPINYCQRKENQIFPTKSEGPTPGCFKWTNV